MWLRAVMLFSPVSTPPGRFGSRSIFGGFSEDVLQAAFNVNAGDVLRIQAEMDARGVIVRVPAGLIRALGKKPLYSNDHGRLFEITGDEFPDLLNIDVELGLANITRGSMMAPSFRTRAATIALVLEGNGQVEVVGGPGVSAPGGRSERQQEQGAQKAERSNMQQGVRADIKEGPVVVLPAGHPATLVAG
ncbi:hypothetical protein BRADI_1g05941v3 [Brachypodium distachyon]|uniref:Cupin type-1 domain-containing protein n=1 Tax=Brachypodium distachyon TaxID=15368 RepID=A0A0Q3GQU1_BRADI|nr:hypothetical protein BRADI_1g05941v3 [Brachypodium distachyon]